MLFGKKKKKQDSAGESSLAGGADAGGDKRPGTWRLIYNPEGEPGDVVAYGASVAEGRIAGKYQLSNTRIPPTVIVQRSKVPGLIVGADVKVDRDAAKEAGISVARTQRQGRNAAKTIGTIGLSELMTRSSRSYEAPEVDADEPAVILYTSGTTGKPKGVQLTHGNFHFQLNTVVTSLVPFTSSDRVVGVLPMYHVFGLANGLAPAINAGACIVLVPQYSPAALLSTIQEQGTTILPAVPTMYQHLLALARARKAEIPKTLQYCVSGGAALPMRVLQQFMETFDTKIIEGYGLTETTSSVCANGLGGKFKEGSIGPPAEGVELKVVDDTGTELGDGEVGEILIRSDTVFHGYWNDPESTAEVLTDDGWFHTGDLGYRDPEGYFFITDRKKDIIITNGFNVSPREVEEVIIAHEKVADVAVIGITQRRGSGEAIAAYIVPQEGSELSEAEMRAYCERELAVYKQPRDFNFVGALPKSPTGKVLRTELRGEAVDRRIVERGEER